MSGAVAQMGCDECSAVVAVVVVVAAVAAVVVAVVAVVVVAVVAVVADCESSIVSHSQSFRKRMMTSYSLPAAVG